MDVPLLKPSQNKKGQKNFQLHRFLNPFPQLPAVKKASKNSADRKFFGPSDFVTVLINTCYCLQGRHSNFFNMQDRLNGGHITGAPLLLPLHSILKTPAKTLFLVVLPPVAALTWGMTLYIIIRFLFCMKNTQVDSMYMFLFQQTVPLQQSYMYVHNLREM